MVVWPLITFRLQTQRVFAVMNPNHFHPYENRPQDMYGRPAPNQRPLFRPPVTSAQPPVPPYGAQPQAPNQRYYDPNLYQSSQYNAPEPVMQPSRLPSISSLLNGTPATDAVLPRQRPPSYAQPPAQAIPRPVYVNPPVRPVSYANSLVLNAEPSVMAQSVRVAVFYI